MSFFGKIVDMLGLVEYGGDEDEGLDQNEYSSTSFGGSSYSSGSTFAPSSDSMSSEDYGFTTSKNTLKGSGKVTTINSDQIKMIVINPDNYDEAREICDYIKDKKPVVVNLESMDFENAQRVMDFLSGSCYSLNGNIQRVAKNIFIVAPNNIDVTSDFKSEYSKGKNSSSLSWMSFNKATGATGMPTTTSAANPQITPSSFGMKN